MDKRLENELFAKYYDAIIEYNKIHMLTGHTEKQDAYERLFLDALLCFDGIDLTNKKLLDIGTGAGLPGVPLKITNPTCEVVLIEAMGKRVKFLNTLGEIGIDVKVLEGRAEELWKDYKEYFDVVTLRAVSETRIALELMSQYVKIGGLAILPKGAKVNEEKEDAKQAAKILGFELVDMKKSTLPISNIETNTLVYKKVLSTPIKYPRVYAQIAKKPL